MTVFLFLFVLLLAGLVNWLVGAFTLQIIQRGIWGRATGVSFIYAWLVLVMAAHVPLAQHFTIPVQLTFELPLFDQRHHLTYFSGYSVFKSVTSYALLVTYCAVFAYFLVWIAVRKGDSRW